MNPIAPRLTGAGLPFPTDVELQDAARARHEEGQRALLPLRLREWRVPASERKALLTDPPRGLPLPPAGEGQGEGSAHPPLSDARSASFNHYPHPNPLPLAGEGPAWNGGGKPQSQRGGSGGSEYITPALRHVARWREDSEWCLVLWGGYRVGKTHAALRWLVEAAKVPFFSLELGQTFGYATSARFISFAALADAAGSFREHHQALVAEAVSARALVLDDVGAQLRAAAPILDQVISARHLHRRPTLITTNLGRDLFVRPDHYGLRVVLRLEEGGAFKGCGGEPERLALLSALDPTPGPSSPDGDASRPLRERGGSCLGPRPSIAEVRRACSGLQVRGKQSLHRAPPLSRKGREASPSGEEGPGVGS